MPLKVPRAVARFNRVVTNPVQRSWAWLVPPWAIVVHRGRKSGRSYRTPVVVAVSGKRIAIAILYGRESDWVRNLVIAGRGEIERLGRRQALIDPRVVVGDHPGLSPLQRALARPSGSVLVAELGEPQHR